MARARPVRAAGSAAPGGSTASGRAGCRPRSRSPWPSSASRGLDAVARQLSVERRGIDAERVGRSCLVAALALEDPQDVRPLDRLERWVDERALGDEWLRLPLGNPLGESIDADRVATGEDDGAL